MTARTAVLERATNEPNQTSPLRSRRHDAPNSATHIRATWTGKYLIITGLSPHHFPSPSTNGDSKPAHTSKAVATRNGLKRKRSSFTAASLDGSNDISEQSQDMSGSNSDAGSNFAKDDQTTKDDLGTAFTDVAPRKRRRKGQKILEEAIALSQAPTPPLPLISEDEDRVEDIDLPMPFLSRTPSPDPNDPDDYASKIYHATYEPLSKLEAFTNALTKFNPAQRRTDNLYMLASNTAKALQAWQDEYLKIDRLTAPHAPIPRKPATGNRQPLSAMLFEDQKEADIYDYIFDAKKVGHQNPLLQRVIRDASGRELRQRGAHRRTGADSALVNAAGGLSEDDGGRASRTRRPVSKYDGVADGPRRRARADDGDMSPERAAPARRGRGGGRGRGGRGRGRGRGGMAMARRIQDLREGSVGTTTPSASGDDDLASEPDDIDDLASIASDVNGGSNAAGDDDDYGAAKRKGRPKGSKNLHVRSDKGVPKGPRAPRPADELVSVDPNAPPAAKTKGTKAPKSEKRSESMTAWWAKRKAAAAEAKRKEAEAAAATAGAAEPPSAPAAKAAAPPPPPQRIQAQPPPPQVQAYAPPPPPLAYQQQQQAYPPRTYPAQPSYPPARQGYYTPLSAQGHLAQPVHPHSQRGYMFDRDGYDFAPPPPPVQQQQQQPPPQQQPPHHQQQQDPHARPLGYAPPAPPGQQPPPPPPQGADRGRWQWGYEQGWPRER